MVAKPSITRGAILLWTVWLFIVVAFFGAGMKLVWSSMALFGLLVVPLPTAVFAYGLFLLLPFGPVRFRFVVHLSWGALVVLAWALPSIAFLGLRGPRAAVLWPLDSLFLLMGDPDWPPKFDWGSRNRWRSIKSMDWPDEPREVLRALSDLIEDNPEYYNLYYERATILLYLEQTDEAIASFDQGLDTRRSGGYFLSYDSDIPGSESDDQGWFARCLEGVGEAALAAEYRRRAERSRSDGR